MDRTTSREIQKQDPIAREDSLVLDEGSWPAPAPAPAAADRGAGPGVNGHDEGDQTSDAAGLIGDNGGGTSGNHGNGTAG